MASVSQSILAQDVILSRNQQDGCVSKILVKALSYTPKKHYKLGFFNADIPKHRAFRLIANNEGVDIIAAGATKQRDDLLLAIKFPIYKGLYGWRIPLVRKVNQELFASVSSKNNYNNFLLGNFITGLILKY